MPSADAAGQLFMLPSVHDPNPLSVVEAMHTGLPLFVSNRIGNHPEAIEEGLNGWTVDPAQPGQVRETLRRALATSAPDLARMGEASRDRAARTWDTERAIERFLDALELD